MPQSGYVQTTAPAVYHVTIVAGQDLTGLTFGDFQLATVSGEVFDDLNDDGTLDPGDPGLAGWTVNLLNSLSKVVATTTTDSSGDYSFDDLGPGLYSIAAVAQPGYVQTAPSSGPISVTASSGGTLTGEDFGAFKVVSLAVSGLATTPASGLQSGMSVVVQWTDTNTGTQAASGSFTDQVVVTNTTTGDVLATGTVLYNAASLGNLAAGAAVTQQYTFTLPNGDPGVGQIQFTVTADYDQDVSTPAGEPNDTATLTETSTLAPIPELVPSDVTGTATADPGEATSVGWTLTNSGAVGATGPWTEQVFLATDSAGDNPTLLAAQSFTGSLAAGQSVPRSMTVPDPRVLPPGNYWFVVVENPLGEVFETNTANNTAVAAQSTSLAAGLTLTLASATESNAAGAERDDGHRHPQHRHDQCADGDDRQLRHERRLGSPDGHDPGRRHLGHVRGRHDQQRRRRWDPDGDADGQRHGRGLGQRHAHRHRRQRAHADRRLEQPYGQRDRRQSGDLRHGHPQHTDPNGARRSRS